MNTELVQGVNLEDGAKDVDKSVLVALNKNQHETIQMMDEFIKILQKNIESYKAAMKQGVIFHYKNGEKVFVPLFFIIDKDMLVVKDEYPVSFETTFSASDLESWFEDCKNILEENQE